MPKRDPSRHAPDSRKVSALLCIWTIAIVLAFVSIMISLGGITKKKAPELATSVWPINGFALQSSAGRSVREAIINNKNSFPDSINASTTEIAERAFAHEPNASSAVTVMALGAQEQSRRRLMEQSVELSRRDSLTSAWMIFDNGKRDDLDGVLEYYDISMRTSGIASSTFLPVVAKVLADDRFIDPLAKLLAKNPPWARRFWEIIIYEKPSLSNAATLRLELIDEEKIPANVYADNALIQNLVAAGLFDEALQLYHRLTGRKATGRSFVRGGNFEQASTYPPLDWQVVSNGDFGSDIDSANGTMNVSAIGSAGGIFARQLIKLPAGDFIFSATLNSAPEGMGILIAELKCAQAITPRFKPVKIPLRAGKNVRTVEGIRSNCSYYWLDISGRANEGSDGFDATITNISFVSE